MGVYENARAAFGYTVPSQQYVYHPQGLDLIGVYNSGNMGERYTQIPLGVRLPIIQVLIPDPRPGDILIVDAYGQVTSDRNTNTEINHKLIWATGSGQAAITAEWEEISEEIGSNVDLNEHHHEVMASGSFVVPANCVSGTPEGPLRYVTWVWGCACSNSIAPQYITVDGDYGRVVVQHFRPRPTL